jgi:nucleoside phosphorylase
MARRLFHQATGADLIDMNSYGAALACEKSKVPLLVLKIRSDAADEAASEDFKKFIAEYQGDLGREVRAWIQSLPLSPDSPQAYDEIQRLLK